MDRFYAVVFSDLERHSQTWTSLPKDDAIAVIGGYRDLAEALSSRFGAKHQNFTGDGHLFLFNSADVAVQFAIALISSWERAHPGEQQGSCALRVGCHFGECAPLAGGASWIGRAIGVAKRVEGAAPGGAALVTETVLDLLDCALYTYEEAGRVTLKGDHLTERMLYRVTSVNEQLLKGRAPEHISAEEAFLRALAWTGTTPEHLRQEAHWYREALRRRSDYPEAHNNLAVVLCKLGAEQDAAVHYREALNLRPDYAEAHYNYGLLLAASGNLGSAIEHFARAIELRPEYVDAHHAMANALRARGQIAAARSAYERTLELRPHYAEAHNNFAILLQDAGEPANAREHYREALRLRPDYVEAHYNFALFLEDLRQLPAAQKHYEQALAIWPDYAEAHNNLAALLHTQDCLEEAEPHYRRTLALRPADPIAHYNFALLLQAKGDTAEAEKHFVLARELTPDTAVPERLLTPRD